MSIEFLVTSLIVVATPGTGVLYTLAAGLSRGMRASIVAAFGCTLGIIPHMAAAILGLAALLHSSALAFQILKYLGVVYLLYMAWNTLRLQGAFTVETDVNPRSTRQVIVSAILAKGPAGTRADFAHSAATRASPKTDCHPWWQECGVASGACVYRVFRSTK